MKFMLRRREHPVTKVYTTGEIELARKFAERAYKEFGNFIRAVVLFGSAARENRAKESDIDILVIVDDVRVVFSQELVQTYRIITEKIVAETSPRFHITSLKLTSFWEYVRAGDPVGINILRDGIAIIDTGLFDPLQVLLKQGRIRPTQESIWAYLVRAPTTLHNSKWHLMQAALDLYWAAIDAAHAALMATGEIPPSPEHVSGLLNEKLVKHGLLEKKYVQTMEELYKLSRDIIRRNIREVTGEQYSSCQKHAEAFVERMRKFVEAKTIK